MGTCWILGPARQSTITFFIERGYKVYTEDLLATWQHFLEDEDLRAGKLAAGADRSDLKRRKGAPKNSCKPPCCIRTIPSTPS